jgi:hypothetical protein
MTIMPTFSELAGKVGNNVQENLLGYGITAAVSMAFGEKVRPFGRMANWIGNTGLAKSVKVGYQAARNCGNGNNAGMVEAPAVVVEAPAANNGKQV